MWFVFVVLMVLNHVVTCQQDYSLIINPAELMILTLADLGSSTVVRDLLTMVRSLRLFGGELNKATVVIGVIGYRNDDSLFMSHHYPDILAELSTLNVELEFLHGVSDPTQSRTMNKLQAFRLFDPLRFSHVLWLDADILVLGDPTSQMKRHSLPGAIDCVPELYSYMVRYPGFNESEMMWNLGLPAVRSLGDNLDAPSGMCNTGVMLLDSVTLPLLIESIEEVKLNSYFESQRNDRFLDSLLLVAAVNHAAIQVNYWSYDWNYMAFFLGEYSNMGITFPQVHFGHFLWDPFFYCRISPQNVCECISGNDHQRSDDILYRSIDQQIIQNATACRFMAGEYVEALQYPLSPEDAMVSVAENWIPDHDVEPRGQGDSLAPPCKGDQDDQLSSAFECAVLWPPSKMTEKLMNPAQTVDISILLQCRDTVHANDSTPLHVTNIRRIRGRLRLSLNVSDVVVDFDRDVIFSEVEQSTPTRTESSLRLFRSETLNINVQLPSQTDDNRSDKDKNSYSPTSIRFQPTETLTVIMRYGVDVDVAGDLKCIDSLPHFIRSKTALYAEHELTHPRRAAFTVSPWHSSQSIALATQLLLPEYLTSTALLPKKAAGRMPSFRSVLFCCDSSKGVQTTQRLLQHFNQLRDVSLTTLLVIARLPDDDASSQFVETADEKIQRLFAPYCTNGHCQLLSLLPSNRILTLENHLSAHWASRHSVSKLTTIVKALRSRSVDFVYWDLQLLLSSERAAATSVTSINAFHRLYSALFDAIVRVLRGNKRSMFVGSLYFTDADTINVMQSDAQSVDPIAIRNRGYFIDEKGTIQSPDAVMQASMLLMRQLVHHVNLLVESPPLFTYADSSPMYCSVNLQYGKHQSESVEADPLTMWWRECAPAWYFWV